MIHITHFDHIQMDVANLEESMEFYHRVFGFRLVEVGLRAGVRWAIVGNTAGLYLCMHEFAQGRGKSNDGLEITHFGLVVEGFDRADGRLRAAGVPMVYTQSVQYHSSRSLYFFDPNVYKIEISESSGGGLDARMKELYG